ncbi:MAG: plastocyanin/azurin family copper-binding protein [Dehalococcoidia bacterium]
MVRLVGLGFVLAAAAGLAACGGDAEADPEEYYPAIEDNENEIDSRFESEVFAAENARVGAEAAVEVANDYIDTLDDLDVPGDAEDAHERLKSSVEDFRDLAENYTEVADEQDPPDALFEDLFAQFDDSQLSNALCELQDLAAEEDIEIAVCDEGGEEAVDPDTLPAEETTEVLIQDFTFQPPHIQVTVGDTVTFTQGADPEPHTATADDGSFDTDILEEEGVSADVTFDTAGEFSYFCAVHPDMLGLVTVVE